jgi:hypothetical protein
VDGRYVCTAGYEVHADQSRARTGERDFVYCVRP